MKSWFHRHLFWVIAGILGCALIAWSAWLFVIAPTPHTEFEDTPASSAPKASTINTCLNQSFECYHDYLTKRTHDDGPTIAMKDLRDSYGADTYVKSQCHQLSHVVGRAAVDKYRTIKESFQHGDSFCWSGYYHGVVEAEIKNIGAEKIKAQTNDLCSGFAFAQRYSFNHYNCVHGMGHGLMEVEDMNLFAALKDCDGLNDQWERVSCYGGAFMENIMIEARGDGKSKFLKPEQPMYPCTAVDTPYKEQCYLMQTSYALQQNQYNFADVFKQCAALSDTNFIATCYQSVGRDASGSTVSDVTRTKANCEQAHNADALTYCVLGAVRDFISYYHSDVQAKTFCAAFSPSVKARCDREVTTYYATFR